MDSLSIQVGGNHYKNCPYQPVKMITDLNLNLNFIQGNIIKYITRYKSKNGKQDLMKVLHYSQLGQELSPKNFALSTFTSVNALEKTIEVYCSMNKLPQLIKGVIEGAIYQNWLKVTSNTRKIILQEYE